MRPAGELDMATVGQLEECFSEAHAAGYRRIVVDLSGLDFMDSTGLTLLTRWTLDAQRDGYEFARRARERRDPAPVRAHRTERAFHVRRRVGCGQCPSMLRN